MTIESPDGSTDRVQLLGWKNLSDPQWKRGKLKYSIPPELALLLKESTVFAKLELDVLRSFTSRCPVAPMKPWRGACGSSMCSPNGFALDDFRQLLCVEADKLTAFGSLNQYAIEPALMEVNALSDFTVTIVPAKSGQRVTGVLIGRGAKDLEGRKAAYAELQRARVGRKARITGTVEEMLPPEVIE